MAAARGRVGAIGLCVMLLMMLPALVNRSPIMFPDTIGYLSAGEAAWGTAARVLMPAHEVHSSRDKASPHIVDGTSDGVSTERSVYYGIPLSLLALHGSVWLAAVGGAMLSLVYLWLVTRRLITLPPVAMLVFVGTVGVVSGLSLFATTLMPDLFAGPMIAGAAMLFAYRTKLTRRERLFWIATILLACLFHKANVAILILEVVAAAAWLWWTNSLAWKAPTTLAAIVTAALASHAAVPIAIRATTKAPVVEAPFLVARLVEDGTIRPYLDRHCGENSYVLCRFRYRLPVDQNSFLWSHDPAKGVRTLLTPVEREQLAREQGSLVLGAVREQPLQQALASLGNFAAQFANVGARRFEQRLPPADNVSRNIAAVVAKYRYSALERSEFSLRTASALMLVSYILGLSAIAILAVADRRRLGSGAPASQFRVVLLLGLMANTAVCGVLSTGADRYQGRIAWIPAIIGTCLVLDALIRQRGKTISL